MCIVRHAKRRSRFTDRSRVLLRPLCSSFEMERSLTGCLISRPRYSARPILFGSRGPSEEASSPPQGVATYASELSENAWEKGYSWYIRLFSGGRTRMALIISVYVIKVIMKNFPNIIHQVDEEPPCGCATSKSLFIYSSPGLFLWKIRGATGGKTSWHRLVTCLFCLSHSPGYEFELTVDQFVHFVLF